ncbi:adipocyte plasma membrane-associated protein-like [Ciona intestinalis]
MSKVRQRGVKSTAPKNSNSSAGQKTAQKNAESFGVLAILLRVVTIISVTIGLLFAVGLNISPFTALPIDDERPALPMSEGVFAENERLTSGIKINDLLGPESVVEDANNNLYTGLDDGRIVRIAPSNDGEIGGGQVKTLFSGKLSGVYNTMPDKNRTRPLGIRLKENVLYVADAAYGFLTLNLKTNALEVLVAPNDVTPVMRFPDDLVFSEEGKYLYLTDVSQTYDITNLAYSGLSGLCDGRVFRFNLKTKKIKTVVTGLCSANGIEVTHDGRHLLISETLRSRVRIVDTMTFKTKELVYLPAMPDNIRRNSKGTYWVAASNPRTGQSDYLQKYPIVRQAIGGLLTHDQIIKTVNRKANMLIEMDSTGKILQTLHDRDGALTHGFSQATELSDGRLALSGYSSNFLGILNLKDSKPIGDGSH